MVEEKTLQDQQDEMRLNLASTLMKTIPQVPDNFHELDQNEQDRLFAAIDARTEKIMQLLDGKKAGRGPARNPRGPNRRTSERFNTPQLDTITPVKKRRVVPDEE